MTEVTSVRVYMRHVRQARMCSRGARGWFQSRGLDWNDFLANGIDAEILEATGDPLALRAVEQARMDDGR